MDINKTYTRGDDENIVKRFQTVCLLISGNYEGYSGICNDLKNSALLGIENYSKTDRGL